VLHYMLERFFYTVLALLVVLTLVFFLTRLSGDPAELLLPTNATQEQVDNLRQVLGLDRPLWEQYYIYMRGVLTQGNLGRSYRLKENALTVVAQRAIPTAKLAISALFFACLIGLPVGVLSGLKPGTWIDFLVQSAAVLGQSVPTFWLGLMLMLLFAVKLGWFPVMGSNGISHLVLPAATLGFPTGALIARMLRSSVLEVRQLDYIRTARAKGLPERVVIFKHLLRNSLIPVITIVMLQMGFMMGGAVVTETVFGYPGMGLLAVQSIYGRDYTVVQTFILLVAAVIILLNLIADFLYVLVDPKVRTT